MNRRRGILIGVGLLTAAAVVGVGLALSSGVQTYVVRRALNDQPGVEATLDRVTLRPGTLHVEGLALRQGSVSLRVPRLDAEVSVWQLIRGRVHLDQVVAHDWELQFSPEPEARLSTAAVDPAAAPPPAWSHASTDWASAWGALAGVLAAADGQSVASGLAGWLEMLNLPVEIDLGSMDLQGEASWRNAGPGADGHARVEISGGGVRPGERGAVLVKIDAEAEGEVASAAGIQSLHIQSTLGIGLANARTINLLSVDAELTGRREGSAKADRYVMQVDLEVINGSPRVGVSLRDEQAQLLGAELRHVEGTETLAGRWEIALGDGSLHSLMLGRTLPSFAVRGDGALKASKDLAFASVDGRIEFEAGELAVLKSELSAVGNLAGVLSFGAEMREAAYRMTQFEIAVQGAAPVLSARLLQGVELARDTGEVRVSRPEDPVISVDILGVPTSWAQPWLAPLVVDARSVKGSLVMMVTAHGLRVVTTQDLSVLGLVVAQEGETLLETVDIAMRAGAEITNEGWQVELDRLDVADESGVLASLSARGGRLTRENDIMKLAGRIEADLKLLHHVPMVAENLALVGGRVDGEFGLGVEDRVSLAATLSAGGLLLSSGEVLPEMQLDGRIDLLPNGAIEAHLPMRFSRENRVSDLTLNVSATPESNAWVAEGSLSGPKAYVADLQGLGLIFAVAPQVAPADAPPAGSEQTAQLTPVWAGWRGTFKTAIGEMSLPNGISLQNVRGDVLIEAQKINFSGVRADVGSGGSVQIEGVLGFDPAHAAAYEATGKLEAEGVEMGPLLRLFDPAKLPTLEGRLNVSAQLQSATRDLDGLAANSTVSARVTSAGGVLRALQVDVQQYIETGRTLATVGGLFAALSGNQKIGEQAQRLQALTTVAEKLSALTFDQLNLEVSRAPRGDLELRDLAIISPGVRLLGNGSIHYAEGTPWWLSPLLLTLKVGAREEMGALLGKLNLVQAEVDTLGYRPLVRDVVLDGTLAKVGTAQLEKLLSRALTR